METTSLERLALLVLSAVLPCACHGNGGGSPAPASATFLIGDTPANDLDFFVAQVSSLQLRRADGTLTDDFLPEGGFGILHRLVDFLQLEESFQWLGSAERALEPGTYVGLVLGFRPSTFQAKTKSGVSVIVQSVTNDLDVEISPPLVVAPGGYARFEIDLDLGAALSGDPESGLLSFEPAGACHADDGSSAAPVEEFLSQVVSVDVPDSSFVVSGIEHANPLGEIRVHLEPGALLLDELNAELTPSAFLATLARFDVLEMDGFFAAGGEFQARRIELGDFDVVERVEGRVVGVDLQNTRFTLTRTTFEKDTAPSPELSGSFDPTELAYDIDTTFLIRDPALLAGPGQLAVGQEVEARVTSYLTGEPFPTYEVEIRSQWSLFEGVIVSIAGPPSALVAELAAHDPAVVSGLVESAATSVSVNFSGTMPVLATAGKPLLLPEDLQVGLEFQCQGELSGPPDAPSITAAELRILPGWLDDALLGPVDAASSSFTTFGGELRDPFGPGVTPGPQAVLVDPACVFTGDLDDAASFFELFGNDLGAGALLDIYGIGTEEPNTIRAFAIRVKGCAVCVGFNAASSK